MSVSNTAKIIYEISEKSDGENIAEFLHEFSEKILLKKYDCCHIICLKCHVNIL